MDANTPSAVPSSHPSYPAPSQSDLAAVAATVAVVGILMALLLTWLIFRLRRSAPAHSIPISNPARPSFAPSEASSKFGFMSKSLRFSHRQNDPSWDFADPDPFAHSKESSFDAPHSPKHPAPAYTPRAHRTKGDSALYTPSTVDITGIDPPPPAYYRDSSLVSRS